MSSSFIHTLNRTSPNLKKKIKIKKNFKTKRRKEKKTAEEKKLIKNVTFENRTEAKHSQREEGKCENNENDSFTKYS